MMHNRATRSEESAFRLTFSVIILLLCVTSAAMLASYSIRYIDDIALDKALYIANISFITLSCAFFSLGILLAGKKLLVSGCIAGIISSLCGLATTVFELIETANSSNFDIFMNGVYCFVDIVFLISCVVLALHFLERAGLAAARASAVILLAVNTLYFASMLYFYSSGESFHSIYIVSNTMAPLASALLAAFTFSAERNLKNTLTKR